MELPEVVSVERSLSMSYCCSNDQSSISTEVGASKRSQRGYVFRRKRVRVYSREDSVVNAADSFRSRMLLTHSQTGTARPRESAPSTMTMEGAALEGTC